MQATRKHRDSSWRSISSFVAAIVALVVGTETSAQQRRPAEGPTLWQPTVTVETTAESNTSSPIPPGRTNSIGALISPADAWRSRREAAKAGGGRWIVVPCDAWETTPEIQSLSDALKGNPRLIYEYVRNHIDYVPIFGLLKGATMTLLDERGTDADQAILMNALLAAAGYDIDSLRFVFGSIRLDGDIIANWLGVEPEAATVGTVLASGGIPAGVWVDGSGALVYVELSHVWVQVSIDGTDYVFDPSVKTYAYTGGIDLADAVGYDRSAFLSGAMSGATVTSDFVQNVNTANIHAGLASYGDELITHIRSTMPNATVADVVGGREIIPVEGEPFRTTLPHEIARTYDSPYIEGYLVPYLHIQHRGIDRYFGSCEVYGRRLTLFENDSNQVELRLDGELIDIGEAASPGSWNEILLEVDHPYTAGEGAYMDQSFTTYLAAGYSYSILNGWGGTGRALIARHQRNIQDLVAEGYASDSEAVLGEALAAGAASYLAQESAAIALSDAVADTVTLYHHIVGFCGQTRGMYFDLPMQATSVVSTKAETDNGTAAFFAQGGFGSAFEWGVIEQTQPVGAISTIKLLDMANTDANRIFDTSAANYSSTVRPQLVGYDSFGLATIDAYINAGYRLILPQRGDLTEQSWSGVGFLALSPSGKSLAHMIAGGLSGGSSVEWQPLSEEEMQKVIQSCLTQDTHAKSNEPINLVTGSYVYEQTDLTVGSGSAPFALAFQRFYDSAARRGDGPLGRGWNHNHNITARTDSDGFQGLGEDSPIDAAANIVELYVAMDVLAAGTSLTHLTVASLCHKWFMDRLIDNAVIVSEPENELQFIRLADGTYNPPQGVIANLATAQDDSFLLTTKSGMVLDFDTEGRISTWTDRNGNRVSYGYNGDELRSISNGLGRFFTLSYASSRLSSVADHAGRSVGFEYDPDGNLIHTTSCRGNETIYEYDLPGRLTKIYFPANPSDAFVTNTYDCMDRVTMQTTAAGHSWNYFCTGFRAEERDPLGHAEVLHFDRRGLTTRRIDRLGHETAFMYDGHGRITRITHPEGNGTGYAYNDFHDVTTMAALPKPGTPLSPVVWTFTYEPTHHLPATVTDGLGRTTSYTYDSRGNLTRIDRPEVDGQVPQTTFTRNGRGQVTRTVDAVGRVLEYDHDAATGDLLSTTVDPGGLGLTTAFEYDAVGNIVRHTDARGNATALQYDPDRRPIQITAPAPFNYITKFTYDADGNLIKREKQTGDAAYPWQTVMTSHTPTGRRATLTDPEGHVTHYSYDARDRLWRETDAELHTTEYRYDAAGRPFQVIDALGHVTQEYTYHPNGTKAGLKDANGSLMAYEYDGLDRTSRVLFSDGSYRSFAYDAVGNLIAERGRGGDFITYTYDALDRPTGKVAPGSGPIEYTYDLAGALVDVTDPRGTIHHDYDAARRLIRVTEPDGKKIAAELDAVGNRTRLLYPDGFSVAYVFDEVNRVSDVRAGATDPRVDFDADGDVDLADYMHLQRCFGGPAVPPSGGCENADVNGDGHVGVDDLHGMLAALNGPSPDPIEAHYTYDALSRRTGVDYINGTSAEYAFDWNNRIQSVTRHTNSGDHRFTYTLDGVGNRTSMIVDGIEVHDYAYDATNRLITANFPGTFFLPDTTYILDDAGNREWVVAGGATPYVSNALNQYTSVGGIPFAYDAKGNPQNDGINVYAYDAENRLLAATRPGHAASYEYDAMGRRIAKTVDGATTSYLYAGQDVLIEYDDAGGVARRYVYGPGIDEPVCMTSSNGKSYYHYDGLGSVVALTDANGNEVETYRYGPYGRLESLSAIGNVRLYTGREWDAETGLYYYRARYYDPKLGRFLQVDPVGALGGINLYEYVKSNPLNRTDPYGLEEDQGRGTGSIGIGGQVVAPGLAAKITVGIVFDQDGKAAMFIAPGFGEGFGMSANVSLQSTVTTADTVYDVSGVAADIGGSAGPVGCERNVCLGGVRGNTYSLGVGPGIPAAQTAQISYTFVGPAVDLRGMAMEHPYFPSIPMAYPTKFTTMSGVKVSIKILPGAPIDMSSVPNVGWTPGSITVPGSVPTPPGGP